MLDKPFLEKKLDMLNGYVAELADLVNGNEVEVIKSDKLKLYSIERLFQLVVDLMIDVNTHVINSGDLGAVDDLQSTFKLLGEFDVLKKEFAEKVAPIVGIRNMLVHRYEKLDKDMFLNNLRRNFSDFKSYLVQINDYLKKSD